MAKSKKQPTENQGMPAAIARALQQSKVSADSESLLTSLIERWGGTDKLAKDIFEEFQGAAKGGMTRQRILEMIQRLIMNNTQHQIGQMVKPSDMSDGELEALAMAYVRRLSDGNPAT